MGQPEPRKRNYLKYEAENGTFFEVVPVRPIRRVLRYLDSTVSAATKQMLQGHPIPVGNGLPPISAYK